MPTDDLIDLEAVVKSWARQEFDAIANKKQRKLQEKERQKHQTYISLTIDWSEVVFIDKSIEVHTTPHAHKHTLSIRTHTHNPQTHTHKLTRALVQCSSNSFIFARTMSKKQMKANLCLHLYTQM